MKGQTQTAEQLAVLSAKKQAPFKNHREAEMYTDGFVNGYNTAQFQDSSPIEQTPSDLVNKGKDWTGVGEQVAKAMEGELENKLRSESFKFPETVNQVEEYEKHFGPPPQFDDLPDSIKDTSFLEKGLKGRHNTLKQAAKAMEGVDEAELLSIEHFQIDEKHPSALHKPLRISERKAFIKGYNTGLSQKEGELRKENERLKLKLKSYEDWADKQSFFKD